MKCKAMQEGTVKLSCVKNKEKGGLAENRIDTG